eukprot:11330451-Alexandrium_andersonii.AAC.2
MDNLRSPESEHPCPATPTGARWRPPRLSESPFGPAAHQDSFSLEPPTVAQGHVARAPPDLSWSFYLTREHRARPGARSHGALNTSDFGGVTAKR